MTKLYELGPESNNLFYGLLDLEHNFFYRVHFKKSAIEHLCKLASDHRPVAVIPLHTCTNWYRNIVDNTNCNRWGLDTYCLELRPDSLLFNSACLIENHSNIDKNLQLLIDNLNFVLEILFYKLPTISKSFDYNFPEKISILFADDPWVKKAIGLELQYSNTVNDRHNAAIEKFFSFTEDFKIDQITYQDELTQKIKQYCLEISAYFFVSEKNLCLT